MMLYFLRYVLYLVNRVYFGVAHEQSAGTFGNFVSAPLFRSTRLLRSKVTPRILDGRTCAQTFSLM